MKTPTEVDLYRQRPRRFLKQDHEFTARELLSSIRRCSTQHRGYMVIEENTAASIGRLYSHPQSAFGGCTEEERWNNIAAVACTERRSRPARGMLKLGARYLLVDALPTSRPILEKLGFVRLTDTWPCIRNPRVFHPRARPPRPRGRIASSLRRRPAASQPRSPAPIGRCSSQPRSMKTCASQRARSLALGF